MQIPQDLVSAAGSPVQRKFPWRKHVLVGLSAALLITTIALIGVNPDAGAAPQLVRFGDWGYKAQSPSQVDYVTMNVYDASNSRISTRREGSNPYCAYGDNGPNATVCYTPKLSNGTYRVEAIAVGTDGSRATVQHTVTVGSTSTSGSTSGGTTSGGTSSGGTSSGGTSSGGSTSAAAGTTTMSKLDNWGYTAADSSKVSFATMNVYDSGNARISTRRENLAPYCAYGDSGAGATKCNVPSLSAGTYRVEAVVTFTNGSTTTLQHQTTVGSSSSAPAPTPVPTTTTTTTTTSGSSTVLAGSGIRIEVGDNWQSIVNANPTGTTFYVEAGTHRRQEVLAKSGQSFVCETRRACVMDGEFLTQYAFRGSGGNVRIIGMKIMRYNNPAQRGAVDVCVNGGSGWLIEDNEITRNATGGIGLGTNSRAINNDVSYNGQIGLKACGSNGLYEGNRVYYNNSHCPNGTPSQPGGSQGCWNWNWEGGGSKFSGTTGLMLRNNTVYGNCGPGLWADINNRDITWQGNTVYGNSASGIFHEIGYRAWIRGNDVRNNGLTITVPSPTGGASRTCSGGGGSWGGAEITVNNSSDTEVTDNYVDAPAGRKGILTVQQNRGGYYAIRNWFHNNRGPDGGCVWAFADWQSATFFSNNNFGTRC